MAFDVGDCVALWRVDTRTTQEIMLRWSLAHPSGSGEVMAQGGTWLMHVTENESKNECASIRLGSFIGGGAHDAHAARGERGGGHSQNSPKSDHEEDTSTERPAMSPVVLSLHTAYSKVLLAAAGANLASSLESSARSRPPPPHIARPPAARAFSSEHLREHDTFMAAQTARSCVMISAQDLVSSLVHDALSPPETQYMVLDARPADAVQQYGAGALPRAVQLDPSLLGDSERLAAWMAAHAGARGCHLCLVDMPIVQATGMALWRRLLLGEGDGVGPAGIAYSNGPPGVI